MERSEYFDGLGSVFDRALKFLRRGWYARHRSLFWASLTSLSKLAISGMSCSILVLSPLSNCTLNANFMSRSPFSRSTCPSHFHFRLRRAAMMSKDCVRALASWCAVFPVILARHRAFAPLMRACSLSVSAQASHP